MRALAVILGALIVAVQYPLWLGKGGWLRVAELDRQLQGHLARNTQLEARNAALAAEVRDLKHGLDALEERARYELGLVKGDEVFFQYAAPSTSGSDHVLDAAPARASP